jgi:valyl-tRNA synthetase
LEDHWILSKLNSTVQDVNAKLATYTFDQAALEAYDFFWKEFCAYYLEIVKPLLFGKQGTPEKRQNTQKLLAIILCQLVRLLHPMAPFITEELFQLLKERLQGCQVKGQVDPYTAEAIKALSCEACIVAPYPQPVRASDINPQIEHTFDLVERVVYTIRNIRGEMKLPPNVTTDVHIVGEASDENYRLLQKHGNIVTALVRTKSLELHTAMPKLGFASVGAIDTLKVMIPLPDELLKQEKVRLAKEQERLTTALDRIRGQLSNEEFVSRAPAQLIEKQKALQQQTERELAEVASKLQELS